VDVIERPRLLAISDIHGCALALDAVLAACRLRPDDTLVVLGDFVDRGPDTRGTIERLLRLERECRLVLLLGNHEEMMLHARRKPGSADYRYWVSCGGQDTLDSYEGDFSAIPAAHWALIDRCRDSFETERHLFTHASYDPELPLDQQLEYELRWQPILVHPPGPHVSGKQAVVGHTSQQHGEILDLGHLKCIDTYCYGGGWLTLLDVERGETWQANVQGQLRGTAK